MNYRNLKTQGKSDRVQTWPGKSLDEPILSTQVSSGRQCKKCTSTENRRLDDQKQTSVSVAEPKMALCLNFRRLNQKIQTSESVLKVRMGF